MLAEGKVIWSITIGSNPWGTLGLPVKQESQYLLGVGMSTNFGQARWQKLS